MLNFYQSPNCKICGKIGTSIFSKKFNDELLKKFFIKYYGEKKYENFKNNLKEISYELLKCNQCKFIWQKSTPKRNFSIDLYENIIDKTESLKKSEKKFNNQKHGYYREIKKIISNFKEKKINVLDFGAGWGHWLISGSSLPYEPYAFELSPSRTKFLISNQIKIINLETINSYENFFHYIRLDQVLEHVDEPNKSLSIIKKLAKDNCIFFISVPDGDKIIKKKDKNFQIEKGPVQPLEHLNCFSKKSLKKILDANGFRPLKLNEIIMMNIKDFKLDLVSFKSFIIDIKNYFFSTSIKFKLKN